MNSVASCFLLLMIVFSMPLKGQITQWARSGTGGTLNHSHRVAVDSEGNVYTTGYFMGNVGFDGLRPIPQGFRSAYLVKYNNAGIIQWIHSAGGDWISAPGNPGRNEALSLCIDSTGNIYIVGYIFGPDYRFDSVQFHGGSGAQAFLAKYNPSGDLLWVRRDSVPPYSIANGVACGPDGNIYMTGRYGEFDGRVFIAKYTPEGVEVWRKVPSKVTGNCDAIDITVNSRGDLFVLGRVSGTFLFDSISITTSYSQDFIAKYDLQGRAIWVRSGQHGTFGVGQAIGADSAGSCYITANGGGGADGFLAKYDSTGTQLWLRGIHAKVNGIAVQSSGEFYCTGMFEGNEGKIDTITLPPSLPSSFDAFIALFNPDGYVMWAKAIRGNKGDEGYGITYDRHDNIYVTGDFGDSRVMYDSLRLDTLILVGYSDRNIFTAKFGPREATSDVQPVINVSGTMLHQNLPNPCSGITAINFELPERMPASLTLHDNNGGQVEVLFKGTGDAGLHSVRLDAAALPSGVYHLRLAAGGTTLTRQIIVAR